jgi:hypothetical protein
MALFTQAIEMTYKPEQVIAQLLDFDFVQVGTTIHVVDRDSSCALRTYVNVESPGHIIARFFPPDESYIILDELARLTRTVALASNKYRITREQYRDAQQELSRLANSIPEYDVYPALLSPHANG